MSKILQSIKSGKQILFNTGWIIFDRSLHVLLSLIVTSFIARYLGKDGYGLIEYGMAFINLFAAVCKLGIDSIIINEIVKNKADTKQILGTTIGLRLISGLLSVGLIQLFVYIITPENIALIMTITFIQSFTLLFQAFDTIEFWFQSKLQSKYSAIAKTISYVLVCIWRLTLVFLKLSVHWFALATVLDALTIGVLLLIFYRVKGGPPLRFTSAMAKNLLSQSHPFIISGILVTVYTQLSKIMLGSMQGEGAVGEYGPAMAIMNMWIFVPIALIDSVRPIIMKQNSQGDSIGFSKRYTQLYSAVIWLNIAMSLAMLFAAKPIILILYGKDFEASVPILCLLAFSKLFSMIGVTRNIWIICKGHSKTVKYFFGSGAVLSLILNYFMIPIWGAFGAGISTLLTEIWTAIFSNLMFRQTRPLIGTISNAFLLRGVLWGNSRSEEN